MRPKHVVVNVAVKLIKALIYFYWLGSNLLKVSGRRFSAKLVPTFADIG
jgi:hypothetical protein